MGKDKRLEEALVTLIQSQATLSQNLASLMQTQVTLDQRFFELERINSERFARIEAILLEHSRILQEHGRILQDHSRILEALPEAIRQKIGFVKSE